MHIPLRSFAIFLHSIFFAQSQMFPAQRVTSERLYLDVHVLYQPSESDFALYIEADIKEMKLV